MRRHSIPLFLQLPRLVSWGLLTLALLAVVAVVSPVQLPVVVYKTSLISLAACAGYWIDRTLFPYARPDGYLVRDWRYGSTEPEHDADHPVVAAYTTVYAAAMMRRAIVVAAAMIGVALGL